MFEARFTEALMSGLLALLDDVAAIAKVAAASVDDIAAAAAKAGSKTAGVVIDDAAVTPKYVQGFAPARELPIIWRIARGSLINKLVLLMPATLLMAAFAPWLVWPLLILGGCYLCFEGAEKIVHVLMPHDDHSGGPDGSHAVGDPTHLEEQKVRGAIKTDFILSAEIMVISLSAIEAPSFWMQAATLAVVAVMITLAVYGAVAVIVKMDDVGLWMNQNGRTGFSRNLGAGIVRFMPWLLKALMIIGTAAMLWVGGAIVEHSLHEMGWHLPYETIKHIAHDFGAGNGALEWALTAVMDFLLGFVIGLILIPIVVKGIMPLFGGKSAAH
jgi:predicted DNA repair protein MutK